MHVNAYHQEHLRDGELRVHLFGRWLNDEMLYAASFAVDQNCGITYWVREVGGMRRIHGVCSHNISGWRLYKWAINSLLSCIWLFDGERPDFKDLRCCLKEPTKNSQLGPREIFEVRGVIDGLSGGTHSQSYAPPVVCGYPTELARTTNSLKQEQVASRVHTLSATCT